MYRILDLDNTIADDGHRWGAINWQLEGDRRYNDYHQLAGFDALSNADLLITSEDIVILTGRPVLFRTLTLRWLKVHGVNYKFLLMRNDGDRDHSATLKRKQLDWLMGTYGVERHQITSAFDDRQDVVDMYRAFGIKNAQLRRIHELDCYNKPKP